MKLYPTRNVRHKGTHRVDTAEGCLIHIHWEQLNEYLDETLCGEHIFFSKKYVSLQEATCPLCLFMHRYLVRYSERSTYYNEQ